MDQEEIDWMNAPMGPLAPVATGQLERRIRTLEGNLKDLNALYMQALGREDGGERISMSKENFNKLCQISLTAKQIVQAAQPAGTPEQWREAQDDFIDRLERKLYVMCVNRGHAGAANTALTWPEIHAAIEEVERVAAPPNTRHSATQPSQLQSFIDRLRATQDRYPMVEAREVVKELERIAWIARVAPPAQEPPREREARKETE